MDKKQGFLSVNRKCVGCLLIVRTCRQTFGTFPQKLWKSLWKRGALKLQVLENFTLLAFCTRARQIFQSRHIQQFKFMKHGIQMRDMRALLPLSLACALMVSATSCVKLPRRFAQLSEQ